MLALTACSVVILFWSIGSGAMDISWREIWEGLMHGFNREGNRYDALIWYLRLPRVLLGFLAGGALGICGAALQGLFRNPLADPGLIGVSGGGALGAALAIVIGIPEFLGNWPILSLYGVSFSAFIGAFLATALVYYVATWQGQIQVATLLLAGIAINAIAGAAIGWFSFMASDAQLRELTFWSLGSVAGASWESLSGTAPFVLAAVVILPLFARSLNALSLGESNARHMGAPVDAMKRWVVIATALAVGAMVAVTGVIGFVGLVAPHLFRIIGGPDHRWVLPGSFMMGGCLLCVADIAARVAAVPAEIPLGVVVSTIGAPFFLFLLMREKRRGGG